MTKVYTKEELEALSSAELLELAPGGYQDGLLSDGELIEAILGAQEDPELAIPVPVIYSPGDLDGMSDEALFNMAYDMELDKADDREDCIGDIMEAQIYTPKSLEDMIKKELLRICDVLNIENVNKATNADLEKIILGVQKAQAELEADIDVVNAGIEDAKAKGIDPVNADAVLDALEGDEELEELSTDEKELQEDQVLMVYSPKDLDARNDEELLSLLDERELPMPEDRVAALKILLVTQTYTEENLERMVLPELNVICGALGAKCPPDASFKALKYLILQWQSTKAEFDAGAGYQEEEQDGIEEISVAEALNMMTQEIIELRNQLGDIQKGLALNGVLKDKKDDSLHGKVDDLKFPD